MVGSNGSGAEGNTILQPKKRDSLAKRWCFTDFIDKYKSEEERKSFLVPKLSSPQIIDRSIVGREICPETKKIHYQGYIEFNTKKRMKQVKDYLASSFIHVEICKGNRDDNVEYCGKDGDIVIDYTKNPKHIYSEQELDLITPDKLYNWQKFIVEILHTKPDPRAIYWIYDKLGNKGKSSLTSYLNYHYDVGCLGSGKMADIACCVCGKDGLKKKNKTYIFDLPRSSEGKISYNAIESVKNGMMFAPKYESGHCMFPKPHVFVFANFIPDIDMLSKDRWHIYDLYNKDRPMKRLNLDEL